jgi:hypothetical protein
MKRFHTEKPLSLEDDVLLPSVGTTVLVKPRTNWSALFFRLVVNFATCRADLAFAELSDDTGAGKANSSSLRRS